MSRTIRTIPVNGVQLVVETDGHGDPFTADEPQAATERAAHLPSVTAGRTPRTTAMGYR